MSDLRKHSDAAWEIASRYSDVLASETRDLAAAIDAALETQSASFKTYRETVKQIGASREGTIASLRAKLESARKALEPFVSLRNQSVHQAVKIINKLMDGMTPVTVTVTKDQYKAAMAALTDEKGKS